MVVLAAWGSMPCDCPCCAARAPALASAAHKAAGICVARHCLATRTPRRAVGGVGRLMLRRPLDAARLAHRPRPLSFKRSACVQIQIYYTNDSHTYNLQPAATATASAKIKVASTGLRNTPKRKSRWTHREDRLTTPPGWRSEFGDPLALLCLWRRKCRRQLCSDFILTACRTPPTVNPSAVWIHRRPAWQRHTVSPDVHRRRDASKACWFAAIPREGEPG